MSKKFCAYAVLFVLVYALAAIVIFADDYDSEGEFVSSTPIDASSDEADSDEMIDVGGISQTSTDFTTEDPGYRAYMRMELSCHKKGRSSEDMLVAAEDQTRESYVYVDDFTNYITSMTEETFSLPYLPYNSYEVYDSSNAPYPSTFFEEENDKYIWTSNPIGVSIATSSEDPFVNAKIHRFEGETDDGYSEWVDQGCIAKVGALINVGITDENTNGVPLSIDDINDQQTLMKYYEDGGVRATYDPSFGYSVDWDENKENCAAIGGSWYDDGDFSGYQCCGDDRMWIKNRAVNENDGFDMPTISSTDYNELGTSTSTASYCLYSANEDEQEENDLNVEKIDSGLDTYICSSTGYSGYDSLLENDNSYETETPSKDAPFFFQGTIEEDETDIGKWSDSSSMNPQFCYYEYNETTIGEEYYWININEAADKPVNDQGEVITDFANDADETLCEKYLGGKWTGSHCCGNKYDYDGAYGDIGYYDESYSETVPIYYDEAQTMVYSEQACLQATAYDSLETAAYVKEDGTTLEILNINGSWHTCNNEGSDIDVDWYTRTSFMTSDAACSLVESSYLCNYNPDTAAWEWYSISSGDEAEYVADTLGYTNGATFTQSPSETPWAAAQGLQTTGCCANNRCWDGTACVDEYTEYTYDVDEDAEESDADDEHYICHNGDWGGQIETKYDWYHNTDAAAIDYCVYPYSCVCSSNEEDETFCVEEGEYYEAGCTLTADFFKNDHFCEAINPQDTDGDGVIDDADSSVWTSRTKFLAFQLMEVAKNKGTDYTLFCDKYTNTLNNYVNVEAIEEDINSFCVLSQDDAVTIGVTFNSDDTTQPMTVDADNLLFEGSTAFVDQILDNDNLDFTTCDNAISADQAEYRFGAFYSCDGTTTQGWYNSVMNSFIYSKDGLNDYSGTTLPYEDDAIEDDQEIFDEKKKQITDYMNSNTLENPAGDELNGDTLNYFAGFDYAEDYNKLYYSENTGTTTFGFEDVKYQEDYDNRYFLGVIYDGISVDCDQVYAPYESTWTIFCDSDAGIVLERSTSGSEYWNSLTAAVRMG